MRRLIDEYVGGRKVAPLRRGLAVGAACAVDRALARLKGAKPILLVNGFWRSGTTWLQECCAEALDAKTVFEPLSPLNPERRAMMAGFFGDDEDIVQAFIPEARPDDEAFWRFLDGACVGRQANTFTLSCRRNARESFKRSVVVKDVRLHRNLDGFHRRYGVPVVHIRRHPCAVVASLLAADWHWSFERVRLAAVLPKLGDASASSRAASGFDMFDTDAVSRIAAFWAVNERCADAALRGQPWGRLMTYEHLSADPASALAGLCDGLGLKQLRPASFETPSASIHPEVFAATPNRSEGWRRSLPASAIGRIEAVADTLYPDWRGHWA